MTDRFINTAADPGGDGTTNATSSGDGSHAYQTINAAEAGEQGDITSSGVLNLICTGTSDSTNVVFSGGWTVNASNFITIKPNATDVHDGVFSASIFHKSSANNYGRAIDLLVAFSVIDGLQMSNTHNETTIVRMTTNETVIQNCLIKSDGVATGADGIAPTGNTSTQLTMVNNVIYEFSGNGVSKENFSDNTTYAFYNNTVDSCGVGMRISSGFNSASRVFNNLLTNNTTDYSLTGTLSNTGGNVTSDATSPETALRNKTITYDNAAGGDYQTSDTDIVDVGTDLTSDSLFPFSTDCIGVSRGSNWDVGAFESVSAGAALTNYYYQRMMVG